MSLERLVGEWEVKTSYTEVPPGRTTFRWILGGAFLLCESVAEKPFPCGHALLTPELQYYFDDRGVVRQYEMAFDGDTWTMSRDHPDPFPQRFTGVFKDGDAVIDAHWERKDPDWQTDFTGTYTRVV